MENEITEIILESQGPLVSVRVWIEASDLMDSADTERLLVCRQHLIEGAIQHALHKGPFEAFKSLKHTLKAIANVNAFEVTQPNPSRPSGRVKSGLVHYFNWP
jgi:hypothetical protein